MANPSAAHLAAAYRILRYLRSTINISLVFRKYNPALLIYSDSDHAGDSDRISVSGLVVKLGSNTIHYSSKKQTSVATSSTEAEYLAANIAVKEGLFFKMLLSDVGVSSPEPLIIKEDNTAVIASVKSKDISGSRLKHLDVALHSLRHLLNPNKIRLEYIRSHANVADVMTKTNNRSDFLQHRSSLSVC